MELRKLVTVLAFAGALMIILAACGTDDGAAPTEVVPVEPTATAEPPDEASTEKEVEPVVFDLDVCASTMAVQLPIEFEYMGTVPTGFDGINRANCTFTKAVETVTVTLTGPAKHSEVFTLSEPSTQVSFPLPEGTLSITTMEIVPPGEYQREITVTSVDGDTLVISDEPGVLKTVTILEPSS